LAKKCPTEKVDQMDAKLTAGVERLDKEVSDLAFKIK